MRISKSHLTGSRKKKALFDDLALLTPDKSGYWISVSEEVEN